METIDLIIVFFFKCIEEIINQKLNLILLYSNKCVLIKTGWKWNVYDAQPQNLQMYHYIIYIYV